MSLRAIARMKSKHSGMLRLQEAGIMEAVDEMKSKHSGMLSHFLDNP